MFEDKTLEQLEAAIKIAEIELASLKDKEKELTELIFYVSYEVEKRLFI